MARTDSNTTTTGDKDQAPRSDIACHSCRKRKIRCDRELPHCTICQRTSQVCEYPSRTLKPGPKIGSTHKTRKRPRDWDREGESATPDSDCIRVRQRPAAGKAPSPTTEHNGIDSSGIVSQQSSQQGDSQETTRTAIHRTANAFDLSFIVHPSHEVATSEKAVSPAATTDLSGDGESALLARASHVLGITPNALERMIDIYFDNMTAINIFHEPNFRDKLMSIGTSSILHALLASICAFSSRFCSSTSREGQDYNFDGLAGMHHTPSHFLQLASRCVNEALEECGDQAPPLSLLQALVLLAHGQLTQGVRGKAWRSLGSCVRLAYESNLHLVDAGFPRDSVDTRIWTENEEKRRVWWAIWEMDVFASTIRRCPTAVDWSQIETLLPVEDEYWFKGTPHASCFLELDLGLRWKALQDSGNRSAKAWFIVINSMMKDAQVISSPRGIPDHDSPGEPNSSAKAAKPPNRAASTADKSREKLETISNSVRCFGLALPSVLRYRNQYLSFEGRQPRQINGLRQQHSGIYNIHVMTQLANLMTNHYDMFAETARGVSTRKSQSDGGKATTHSMSMQQYFEAADEILKIVHRSGDDHIQYINAFLTSTIWLASAVQLVRKEFGPPSTNKVLIKSRFEVLHMTYKKCVSFWDIQTAMQQNLEMLESQLEGSRTAEPKILEAAQPRTTARKDSRTQKMGGRQQSFSSARQLDTSEASQQNNSAQSSIQYRAETNTDFNEAGCTSSNFQPLAPAVPEGQINSNVMQLSSVQQNPSLPVLTLAWDRRGVPSAVESGQAQTAIMNPEPISPALSVLDYMPLPTPLSKQMSQHTVMDNPLGGPSPESLDYESMFAEHNHQQGQGLSGMDMMQNMPFGLAVDEWNFALPSYVDNLLSGACMYGSE